MPSPETNANFITVENAIGDLPLLKSGEQGALIKDYICEPFLIISGGPGWDLQE
jgi:DNA (cytosine-5)-methyltransferase 1